MDKLGCKAKLRAPVQQSVGAPFPREAFGRIVGTHRVQGMNNVYATCVPTFYLNALTDAAARDGKQLVISDQVAVDLLKEFDPTLLEGMDPEDILEWGMENAVYGYQLESWKRLDIGAEADIRNHVEVDGAIGLVVDLSLAQQGSATWVVNSSANVPGSWGEHMACFDGFDGSVMSGTSWGRSIFAARNFFIPEWTLGVYAVKFKGVG
jgi:hypothetical protein